jgi:hypothetical protein
MNKGKLQKPTPIVADGAIATTGVGEGRLVPALILDCDENRTLHELIVLHEDTPPGDVLVTWGRPRFDKSVALLVLEFKRPIHTKVVLSFDVAKQGGLVDGIIHARGVYLQSKDFGHTVSAGLNNPKILVEIPASATYPGWDSQYQDVLVKQFKRHGFSRTEAKQAATEHMVRLRELWHSRMRGK